MKLKIEIEYSTYSESVENKGGKQFIGVRWDKFRDTGGLVSGGASPCDTREEAIKSMKSIVSKDDYENETEIKAKDIDLDDKTDLNFTLGEILGQDLNRWFK